MKVDYNEGTQLLFYPMKECTIAAGYKNKAYAKSYGYVHYGVDFDDRWGKSYDVLASGKGTVLATEKNQNSIGGVVVIRYDDVYNPTTKKVQDLIVRYYHMYTVDVKAGQVVFALQKLGTESGTHQWWNHIHMEIDTDVKHPYYTPQVAEASSKLLIRKGATDATMLNPIDVLVVSTKQTAMVHNLAKFADKVIDKPKYEEGKKITAPKPKKIAEVKPQKLALPIDDARVTCGYKNKTYKTAYHLEHYGMDMISASNIRSIKAQGDGIVKAAGWDGTCSTSQPNSKNAGCGYVVVIIYNNVYNHATKKSYDVTCTLMHLAQKPYVKAGDKVTKGTVIGLYGATGSMVDGAHLHVQYDLDTTNYLYCMPMAATGHAILKRGSIDSTIEPCNLMHLDEGQTIEGGKYPTQYNAKLIASIPKA